MGLSAHAQEYQIPMSALKNDGQVSQTVLLFGQADQCANS